MKGYDVSLTPHNTADTTPVPVRDCTNGWWWDGDRQTPVYLYVNGDTRVTFYDGRLTVVGEHYYGHFFPLDHGFSLTVEPRR